MSECAAKIGFWLRAYDGFTIEASSIEEAIEKSKARAKSAIESLAQPDHIDWERREGVIVYIDRITEDGRVSITENVAFDDDQIHPALSA